MKNDEKKQGKTEGTKIETRHGMKEERKPGRKEGRKHEKNGQKRRNGPLVQKDLAKSKHRKKEARQKKINCESCESMGKMPGEKSGHAKIMKMWEEKIE